MTTNPLPIAGERQFDADGRERRKRVCGHEPCTTCGAMLEFIEETEVWTEGADGRWLHESYGPASAFCEACELAYCNTFDGCFVIDLEQSNG